jgi:uncharacterized protein (TIGR03067 family)
MVVAFLSDCPLEERCMSAGIRFAAVLGLFTLAFPAPAAEKERDIKAAIERGVAYLKARQTKAGFWRENDFQQTADPHEPDARQIGITALAGLALLECGVDPGDPVIGKASDLIRDAAPIVTQTYTVSLILLYLERLGDANDLPLIDSLTVRLLGGQGMGGGWGYKCPAIGAAEVHRLGKGRRAAANNSELRPPAPVSSKKRTLRDMAPEIREQLDFVLHKMVPPAAETEDNSNTQFATLALWVGRRHGLPVDDALKRVATHFHDTQNPDGGWDYKLFNSGKRSQLPSNASMTCAGLLGMAVAYGLVNDKVVDAEETEQSSAKKGRRPRDPNADPVIRAGLVFLGQSFDGLMAAASVPPVVPGKTPGLSPVRPGTGGQDDAQAAPPAPVARPGGLVVNQSLTYFLWSLERVAVIYDLDTIGNRDWYAIGARYLVPNQERDGSWRLVYRGVIDTSFVLLFLQRCNLAPDLTARLKGKIKDPGEVVLRSRDLDPKKLTPGDSKPREEKRDLEPKLLDPGRGPSPAAPPDGSGSPSDRVGPVDSEAARLGAELLKAPADRLEPLLDKLRDAKGPANTEALALAIPQLHGESKQKARDALAERLSHMTAATLRAKLQEENSEIRRAAVLACMMKNDASLVADLIPLLEDQHSSVSRATYAALKKLTGQDLGPSPAKWRDGLANKDGLTDKTAAPSQPEKPKAEPQNTDKESLQGTWALEGSEALGKPATKLQVTALRLKFIFAGDRLTLQNAGGAQKTRIELGPDKDPKTIDIIASKDVSRGIYELNGDTLRICWVPDGEPRPRTFATTPRGKETLYTFKRQ